MSEHIPEKDATLEAIRKRDRRVVARLGRPERDPLLRAEMDRRWLLAEVDRLRAERVIPPEVPHA